MIALERKDVFLHPRDGVSEGMIPPKGAVEEVVDVVIGGILHHLDLLEDHHPLPFYLLGVEGGMGNNI